MIERSCRTHRQRGFTLLEVMVALIIFSICATTLIKQSGINLRQTQALETRTLANWIASNELERLRLEGFPSTGSSSRDLHYSNRQWQVERRISNTQHPDLRRADIRVTELSRTHSAQEGVDHQLTGYLGRH